jgi:hypothetical protein
MIIEKKQRWNPKTKSMEESPILEYIGPRKFTDNQYEGFKRHAIVGKDGKDISQARHGMQAKELMEIRSNQKDPSDPFADSGQCSANEKK